MTPESTRPDIVLAVAGAETRLLSSLYQMPAGWVEAVFSCHINFDSLINSMIGRKSLVLLLN